jgi:hypothetical protein
MYRVPFSNIALCCFEKHCIVWLWKTLHSVALNNIAYHCFSKHCLEGFFVGIWSWLADKLHLILSYEAGFYEPTVFKVHSPFLQDYSICNNARLISNQFLLQVFDQMNGAWKMVSSVGGLNPRPLSHESSALISRPQLLAFV